MRSRTASFDLQLRTASGPKGSAHTQHCCQCQPWGRADSWAQGWAITLGWWQSQGTVLWGFYVVHYDISQAVVYGMSWHGPFLCWCVSVGKTTSRALEVLGLGYSTFLLHKQCLVCAHQVFSLIFSILMTLKLDTQACPHTWPLGLLSEKFQLLYHQEANPEPCWIFASTFSLSRQFDIQLQQGEELFMLLRGPSVLCTSAHLTEWHGGWAI